MHMMHHAEFFVNLNQNKARNKFLHVINMQTKIRQCLLNLENRQINKRNQAHRMLHSESHVQELIDLGELKEDDEKGLDLPFYDLESIRVTTGNFSDENKLGQGGYGLWACLQGNSSNIYWSLMFMSACFSKW